MNSLSDSSAEAAQSTTEQHSEAWLEQEKLWIARFFKERVPEELAKSGKTSEGCKIPTANDCESFARHLLQAQDIEPVKSQGATSYTLICPSQAKIIQFRLKPLDEGVLTLAHRIYGDLVPSIMSFGSFSLPVYVCPVIPGQVHMLQKFPKGAFPLQRQLTTVTELAQFVAKSAFWPQPVSTYSPTSWTKTARSNLDRLTQNDSLRKIEPRFANKASSLLEKVSLLDKLPPVLTHHDFAEVNIMVDLQGHVTGVIDFDDAQTEAFGMCIFGVYEGFFGVMKDQKWSFFDEPAGDGSGRSVRNVLDTAFWDTLWGSVPPGMRRQEFEEAVMVAVDIGIVNRYFVRGLIENVNLESEDHRSSLEFARGIFLER
ncbi:hypothetical protein F4824DRAFT_458100 [Ustulina deusta]|nr:hypothetical protein F4824DRAFT_458100 [Ustulina deusta]